MPLPPADMIDGVQQSAILGQADTAQGAVRMQVALRGPAERVWRALTVGEHTVSWLGRLDVGSITEGARFDLWHDQEVRSRHSVVQWQPGRLLTLSWEFPGERPSRVTLALTEAPTSAVTLALHHEGLEDVVSYAAGWHRHLEYLEAHLKGQDLPTGDFWCGYEHLVERYGRHGKWSNPQT